MTTRSLNPAVTLFTAAFFCVAAAAKAETKIDFDQGIDVPALAAELEKSAEAAQAPEGTEYEASFDRTERDCATVSFYGDDPLTSERIRLESREYRERCYPAGPRGERNCHEEWYNTERRSVRIRISNRGEMLPWERDVFEICLDGRWLSAYVVDASHKYDLDTPGWNGDTVEARALYKTASLPDPAGLAPVFGMDPASGNFKVSFQDRWTSFYAGERISIEVKLRRYHKNWFDSTVLKDEIGFDTAASYDVNFADYAEELGSKLAKGKQYYVEYRFKRLGSVSKDKWTSKVETPKRSFEPAALTALSFEAAANVCWFKTIEKDQCVYKCRDGKEYRRQVSEPDPFDPDRPVLACPQVVVPF